MQKRFCMLLKCLSQDVAMLQHYCSYPMKRTTSQREPEPTDSSIVKVLSLWSKFLVSNRRTIQKENIHFEVIWCYIYNIWHKSYAAIFPPMWKYHDLMIVTLITCFCCTTLNAVLYAGMSFWSVLCSNYSSLLPLFLQSFVLPLFLITLHTSNSCLYT